jgi:hypothetical protein
MWSVVERENRDDVPAKLTILPVTMGSDSRD